MYYNTDLLTKYIDSYIYIFYSSVGTMYYDTIYLATCSCTPQWRSILLLLLLLLSIIQFTYILYQVPGIPTGTLVYRIFSCLGFQSLPPLVYTYPSTPGTGHIARAFTQLPIMPTYICTYVVAVRYGRIVQ